MDGLLTDLSLLTTSSLVVEVEYSCIIPTRDRCGMVQEAVASVLAQEVPPAEVVVVDDGSRDDTAAVLQSRFGDRVRLLRLSGLGPGPARNAGVAAAATGIIMFLDSDDLWQPDHARRLLARLAAGYEVAYGPTRNLDRVGGGEFLLPSPDQVVEGDCFAALLRWCFLVPSAMALTRRAFADSGGFAAIPMAEDWLFFLTLADHHPFAYAAGPPLTLRRLHHGSLCRLATPARLLAALRQLEGFFAPTPGASPVAPAWQHNDSPAARHQGIGPEARLTAGAGFPLRSDARRRQANQRFAALADWTEAQATANGEQGWQTVQEWYLALQRANL